MIGEKIFMENCKTYYHQDFSVQFLYAASGDRNHVRYRTITSYASSVNIIVDYVWYYDRPDNRSVCKILGGEQ